MHNLIFKLINCDGVEVEYKYNNPSDFLSKCDYGNDEETMELPSFDDEVIGFIYYGNYISLKQNNITTVLDVYDYCAERE